MSKKSILFLLLSLFFVFSHCSQTPNPRVVVMDFIEAVNKSDTAYIENNLDLERFAREKASQLSEAEQKGIPPNFKENLKGNFLGNGATRLKWQDKLIVVNKENIEGDLAEVEVTFIDQQTGIKEYTKAKLYKRDNKWWIYYIKD
ncbi:MAG: hypothetical protein WCE90_12155 [Candidatus Zixiibacteriota bacterium]